MTADLHTLLDTDPAAGLRGVAKLMRERAEIVERGGAQWTGSHYWVTDHDPSDPSGQTAMQRLVGGMDEPDCDHYSAWHPAVALAVADWLDNAAHLYPFDGSRPLAVANAYLGQP